MSSLTEQERIGLEEVFLSISTPSKEGGKLRELSRKFKNLKHAKTFEISVRRPLKLVNMVLKRIKFSNFHQLLPKKKKKKKNLS